MAESIIIESNRQISLKDELNSLANTAVNEGYKPPSNSAWTTNLQTDILLQVGDQIQVETCSIQTLGSPDTEIEFSGKENVTNAFDLVDNEAQMEIGFYVSNRQQFNANLPLRDMEVIEDNSLAQAFEYYLPKLDTFANFKKAYPYRGIEGFSKSGTTYSQITDGVIVKPPSDLSDANPLRLTLGDNTFKGYNTASGAVVGWNERTSFVNIDVGTGFKTPSTVGEIVTSQFHNLDQIQPYAIQEDFDTPYVYVTVNNTLQRVYLAGTPDKTYKSIVTSTGDIFKAYQAGQWSATLPDTGGTEGDNYVQQQGEDLLYRNLLVGNPQEWGSVSPWLSTRENTAGEATFPANFDNVGTYSGNANYNGFGVGQYGTFPCLLDQLDSQATTNDYLYPTGRTTTNTVNNITYANIPQYQLITTNIIYNFQNIERVSTFLLNNRVPVDNDNLTPQTPQSEVYKYYTTELKFGRSDDNRSLGENGHKVMAPLIPKVVDGTTVVQNSYQQVDGTYRLVGFSTDGRSTTRHSVNVYTHFDESLVDLATFPTNTDFRLTDSGGHKYSTALSKQFQCAVIPVFKISATGNLIDVPFCAFMCYNASANLPYIEKGEFLGASPSFYDNQVAKIVSTQKNDDGSTNYPTSTDPQDYANVIYIGAQNPTLKFDDTVSKFSFTDFHTPVYGSNGTYQEPLPANTPNASVDETSMCVNSKEVMISGTQFDNNPIQYANIAQSNEPYLFISSQSGITIKALSMPNKSTGVQKQIDNNKPLEFSGTLFDKLGFNVEQLLPYAGQNQIEFNRSNYNDNIGVDVPIYKKYTNMVSPFTTNAYISGSNQLSLSGLANGLTASLLGTQNDLLPVFIQADSDELIAINPAQKLDYPYLTISSNIVPSTLYYSPEGTKIPAMAYVNRSFTQGDFFFGQTQSWVYTVDKDYRISSINTSINLPNGKPAPIDGNSSVIYKVTRAKALPPPPPQLNNKK